MAAWAGAEQFYRDRYFGSWGGRDIFAGPSPALGAIRLQSNDYLHLARDPRIVDAQIDALREYGNGALMSGVLIQDHAHPQRVLEAQLAEHLATQAVVICQSGWEANVGLLQTISGPGDAVYVDSLAHMSLWEGARIAGATPRSFRHNTPDHLAARIGRHGPGIVLVDSIYSTNGSICPLAGIAAVTTEHGCVLVVDESHSLGTHGPAGAGLVAELGLCAQVDFITASLAKTFVGRAGMVTCTGEFARYFRYTSRPAVFSSTLLPHDVAGLTAALTVIRAADDRRERLAQISTRIREHLTGAGVDLDGSASQIIALPAGPEGHAAKLRDELDATGIIGSLFAPPATNAQRCLIRLSLHAGLTDPEVDRIIAASHRWVGSRTARRRPDTPDNPG